MQYLDWIAALGIAVLTGMGVGSGGLLVIYLTLVRDASQLTAQGLNLLFYLCSAGASLPLHAMRRRLFPAVILPLSAAGLVGAWIGSAIAPQLDPSLLRRLFGGMLVISGTVVLLRRERPRQKESRT
ncbi:MAG: sulfite exporter TauE/SafE family protein [Clostridia bacterium]|nr:sulfite exporter TauE/SafE family protein [Clostridia bacterium]